MKETDKPEYDIENRGTFEDLLHSPKIKHYKQEIESNVYAHSHTREQVLRVLENAKEDTLKSPLISAFLLWAEETHVKNGREDFAKIIFDKELMQFEDNLWGLLTLRHVTAEYFINTIEQIRCHYDLSIEIREGAVNAVIDFSKWLTKLPFLNHLQVTDPDREKVANRAMEYTSFLVLLQNLDPRMKPLAKLLYFGLEHTLEEILQLRWESIDFKARRIQIGQQSVSFPAHVFQDLRSQQRESGPVFLGRANQAITRGTIFRAFRQVSAKLGKDITPKSLNANVVIAK